MCLQVLHTTGASEFPSKTPCFYDRDSIYGVKRIVGVSGCCHSSVWWLFTAESSTFTVIWLQRLSGLWEKHFNRKNNSPHVWSRLGIFQGFPPHCQFWSQFCVSSSSVCCVMSGFCFVSGCFQAGESPPVLICLLLQEGFQAQAINTQVKSIVLSLMFTSEAGGFQSVRAILARQSVNVYSSIENLKNSVLYFSLFIVTPECY